MHSFDSANRKRGKESGDGFHRDTHPRKRFSDGGNYLNFPGFVEERNDLLRGAYGRNLERLQRVKAQYDPMNLFPGLLNITPKR